MYVPLWHIHTADEISKFEEKLLIEWLIIMIHAHTIN